MKNLEEVRAAIIDAAEKNFSLLGFEKTTLDGISGENGKCKTSIYYHFKNKHDVFKSVILKEFNAVKQDLQAIAENKDLSRTEAMRQYLHTRLESLRKQGAFRRYASSKFAYGDNPVSRAVREMRKPFDEWETDFLTENISRGVRDGSISATIQPGSYAKAIVDILKAVELQFFTSEDRTDLAQTYNGIIDIIVR